VATLKTTLKTQFQNYSRKEQEAVLTSLANYLIVPKLKILQVLMAQI